jgi:hypothetical protein
MYKALLTATLFCLAGNTYAQQIHNGTPVIEPFAVGLYVGIPRNGKVQFYQHTYDEQRNGYFWENGGDFSIPVGAVGISGNERKLIVLFKDSIVFYDQREFNSWERQCAFSFDTSIRVTPQNWLRNAYSTECEFSYLEGNQEKGYILKGDKWLNISTLVSEKTKPEQPPLPCRAYKYVYHYMMNGIVVAMITNNAVTFCLPSMLSLPALKKHVTPSTIKAAGSDAQSRTFTLPSGTKSAFVYMQDLLAAVNKQGIEFYRYSLKNKWEKRSDLSLLLK